MKDHELIAATGQALYGDTWKSDLARALEVSRDTVDDWTRIPQGRTEPRMRPRPGVWTDLAKLVAEREKMLARLAPAIAKASAAAKDRQA